MSFDRVMYEKELKFYNEYANKVQMLLGVNVSYLEDGKTKSVNYKEMRNELNILNKGLHYLIESMGYDSEKI